MRIHTRLPSKEDGRGQYRPNSLTMLSALNLQVISEIAEYGMSANVSLLHGHVCCYSLALCGPKAGCANTDEAFRKEAVGLARESTKREMAVVTPPSASETRPKLAAVY